MLKKILMYIVNNESHHGADEEGRGLDQKGAAAFEIDTEGQRALHAIAI